MSPANTSQSCIVVLDETHEASPESADALRQIASHAKRVTKDAVASDQSVVVIIPSARKTNTPRQELKPGPHRDFAAAMRDVERTCYG